jgi:hypothetical protein
MDKVLQLHNVLRWLILFGLLTVIIKIIFKKEALKSSKMLLIYAHITLVIGLFQYFFAKVGYHTIKDTPGGMKAVMSNTAGRFWAVEHAFSMILAIVFITIAHIYNKRTGKTKTSLVLYLLALVLILLMTPWPFKAEIGRPWFPWAS